MTESFFEVIMGTISLLGLFGLLVSIFLPFETDEYEDYQIIVSIMVNILLMVYGSIYSNFILFQSLHQFSSYL